MNNIQTDFCIRLKDYRAKKGATQQEVADYIGVDKTTYAHYESGRRRPDIERLTRLAMYYHLTEELLGVTNDAETYRQMSASGRWRFPVICPGTPIDMSRIYPTRQKTILSLYNNLRDDRRTLAVMLFGSSVTLRCHQGSDIDLAVRLKDDFTDNYTKNIISESIQKICDWQADILWYDRIGRSERVYSSIMKGVQII